MSDKERASLNLDELFGVAKPIVVRWQDRDYTLLPVEALGPRELMRIEHLQKQLASMGDVSGPMTEQQADLLGELCDGILSVVSRELAEAGLPFMAKISAIRFYSQKVRGEPDPNAPSPPTGAGSTAD